MMLFPMMIFATICCRPHQGIIFLLKAKNLTKVEGKDYQFPSPLGDYFFNQLKMRMFINCQLVKEVAVPIRGLFFNLLTRYNILTNQPCGVFPSPLGDYFFNNM